VDLTTPGELTPAEDAVTRGLVRGLSYEQIARERGTSVRTVANQVRATFRKLEIHSRAELFYKLHAGARRLPRAAIEPARALAGLSPRARTVLVRRAFGDSLKLIAHDLGVSPTTICRELQRGMAALGLAVPAELVLALCAEPLSPPCTDTAAAGGVPRC